LVVESRKNVNLSHPPVLTSTGMREGFCTMCGTLNIVGYSST